MKKLVTFVLSSTLACACGSPAQPAPKHAEVAEVPQSDANGKPQSDPVSPPTQPGSDHAHPASTDASGAGSGDPSGGAGAPSYPAASTGSSARPKRISASHVLIQYMGSDRASSSVVRTRDQAHALAEKVLERAKAGEDFSRLAVDYSDEPGAAQRGGSLGRFGHGQMVRAFEEAAFALEVGQVSDIVETPFGFHIIKRTE